MEESKEVVLAIRILAAKDLTTSSPNGTARNTNLWATDFEILGESNPYVMLQLDGFEYKTAARKKTNAPHWHNEVFILKGMR